MNAHETTIDKYEEIEESIQNLFSESRDWVVFYRQVLGAGGIIRRAYPSIEAMAEFEQTELYRRIHRMVTELRMRVLSREEKEQKKQEQQDILDGKLKPTDEPTRVITVRIPKSMHEALRIEAFEHRTSMNKLCISKLLQFADAENVPTAIDENGQGDDL